MCADTPFAVGPRYFAKCLASMLMLRSISWSLLNADEGGRVVTSICVGACCASRGINHRGTEHDDLDHQQSFQPMLREPSGSVVAAGRGCISTPRMRLGSTGLGSRIPDGFGKPRPKLHAEAI
jgi:hypothetical protein